MRRSPRRSSRTGTARCPTRCRGAGIEIPVVVDSATSGTAKPDPAIFRRALDLLGVAPDRALHVGDLQATDGEGARAAGVDVRILDRSAAAGAGTIASLTEILDAGAMTDAPPGHRRRPRRAAADIEDAPVIAPVQRSVIFEFDTAQRFGEVMEDASLGYLYSRIRNPSGDELAGAVAALEGAEAAHCSASGMAAINGALRLLAPPGAGIVAGTRLYGQTHAVLRSRDDVTFVDLDDEAAVARALEGASVLYAETISNPRCDVADLAALARIAHAAGARLLVDNTMASPVGCRPLALGADLVVHSATKYLNGHSDAVAGVAAGPADLVARLAADEVDTGAMLSPDSAWLVRRGLRTLPLRWERECSNALAIARFLEADSRVAGVFYPGLPSHPHHERAGRLLNGAGGVLAFTVTGGRAGGERLMDRVALCLRATSLGGIETTLSHPASTSHRQLSDGELEDAGIDQGMLRLSVGCEDVRDLIADLDQAL